MSKYGIQTEANPGRELYQVHGEISYARYPIATPLIMIGTDLDSVITEYAQSSFKEGDILCIASKLVSVTKGYVVHESQVKITWLAKLIVRFVKKWPNDIGYSHPRKMQLAINTAGYPRIILALVFGSILKLFGKPGYFYKIAGNRINSIDGFAPHATPPFNEYAFMPPPDSQTLADEIAAKFNVMVAILDGNNVTNHVFGMSKKLRDLMEPAELTAILQGNPQGQDDDGVITPMLIVRKA